MQYQSLPTLFSFTLGAQVFPLFFLQFLYCIVDTIEIS